MDHRGENVKGGNIPDSARPPTGGLHRPGRSSTQAPAKTTSSESGGSTRSTTSPPPGNGLQRHASPPTRDHAPSPAPHAPAPAPHAPPPAPHAPSLAPRGTPPARKSPAAAAVNPAAREVRTPPVAVPVIRPTIGETVKPAGHGLQRHASPPTRNNAPSPAPHAPRPAAHAPSPAHRGTPPARKSPAAAAVNPAAREVRTPPVAVPVFRPTIGEIVKLERSGAAEPAPPVIPRPSIPPPPKPGRVMYRCADCNLDCKTLGGLQYHLNEQSKNGYCPGIWG